MRDEHGRCLLVPMALKTEHSRRTLQLEDFTDVGQALAALRRVQAAQKPDRGGTYQDGASSSRGCWDTGSGISRWPLASIGSVLRRAWERTGPRASCGAFVSQQSDEGRTIEQIADAVGHSNRHITQTVYRHALVDMVRIVPRRPR